MLYHAPGFEVPAGSTLEKFVHQAAAYAHDRRREVEIEYGPGSYNLIGVIAFGSVAAGTEWSGSDVDICPVTHRGEGDVADFAKAMFQKIGHPVEHLSIVEVDSDNDDFVEAVDWNALPDDGVDAKHGSYSTAIRFFPLGHHVQLSSCNGCPDQGLVIPGLDEL